jgi:KDO2-lipid IV(A) lauroyltransferase
VTLWHDAEDLCIAFHDEVVIEDRGDRRKTIAATVQAVGDVFETEIRDRPADWHMLQALWTADLDDRRSARRGFAAPLEPEKEL